MSKYVHKLAGVTGTRRLADYVVGAAGLVPAKSTQGAALTKKAEIGGGLGWVAGAGAGALFWKKHRWLGLFGGGALGAEIGNVVGGGKVVDENLGNVIGAAAGVYGSLRWKKHPVWGFILPSMIVGAVARGLLGK